MKGGRAFVVGGTGGELAVSAVPKRVDGEWRVAVAGPRPSRAMVRVTKQLGFELITSVDHRIRRSNRKPSVSI
jgi:hypothetical protein